MIQVPLAAAIEFGAPLARPIFGLNGQTLLRAGTIMVPQYAERLSRLGISTVYVDSGKIEMVEPIRTTCRLKASEAVKMVASNSRDVPLQDIVGDILSDIMSFNGIVECLNNISSHDGYTFTHSVDVCVLAMCIGKQMGYSRAPLIELGIGALLHDVGKLKIPHHIINKINEITDAEFDVIKTHSHLGHELVKNHKQVCERSARMVLEHHERYDKSGYPEGKPGKQIDRFSSICAIADVYNAMTTHKTYRAAHPPHEVYEWIMGLGDTHFEFKSVQAFSKCVVPYPRGSIVTLSSGRTAQVLENNIGHPYLPMVVFTDTNEEEYLDLFEERIITITGLADTAEIVGVMKKTA